MQFLANMFPNANKSNLPDDNIRFRQEGASIHFARSVHLNQCFPGRFLDEDQLTDPQDLQILHF